MQQFTWDIVGGSTQIERHRQSRRDLEKLGIRQELHLYEDGNKLMKPVVEYTFQKQIKKKICRFVKSIKFPNGFASNLSKNVTPNDS